MSADSLVPKDSFCQGIDFTPINLKLDLTVELVQFEWRKYFNDSAL